MQDDTRKALQSAGQSFSGLAKQMQQFQSTVNSANQAMAKQGTQAAKTSAQVARSTRATQQASQSQAVLAQRFREAASAVAVLDGPLGGVASRFSSFGTLVRSSGVQLAAYAVGVSAVVFSLRQLLTVGSGFETQMLTIENLLRTTGRTATMTSAQINDMAYSLADSTLASTTAARQAAQQLLTFRHVGVETFERTLVAAQDLAANGFVTLEGGAVAIARAFQDPVNGLQALRRAGIIFSDTQKREINALIEDGKSLEAQFRILEEIEKRVGGSGAVQGQGSAGAWDSLVESIQSFIETFTTASGVLGRTTTIIGGITEGVKALTENMDQVILVTQSLTTAFAVLTGIKLAGYLLGIGKAALLALAPMKLLNLVMKLNPALAIAGAIAAAAAALVYFKDTTVSFGGETVRVRDIVAAAWEVIKEGFSAAVDMAVSAAGSVAEAWDVSTEFVSENFGGLFRLITTLLNRSIGAFVAMARGANNAVKLMRDAFWALFDDIMSRAGNVAEAMRALLRGDFSAAAEFASRTWSDEFGFDLSQRLGEIGSQLGEDFAFDYVGAAGEAIADGWDRIAGGAAGSAYQRFLARVKKQAEEAGISVGEALAAAGGADAFDADREFNLEALEKLRDKLQTAQRNAQEYQSSVRVLNTALRLGNIELDEYNRLLGLTELRYGQASDAIGQFVRNKEIEIRTIGMEESQRRVVLELIKLENDAIAAGLDIRDAEVRARLQQAAALAAQAEAARLAAAEAEDARKQAEQALKAWNAMVGGMQLDLDIARLRGRYAEADARAMRQLNQLKQQGVEVTTDMTEAVKEYHRAMQEATGDAFDGFQRWVESIKDAEEALEDIKFEFASGLSDAINDALWGGMDSFEKFFQNIGKMITKSIIDRMMADMMTGFLGMQPDRRETAADRAQAALDKLAGIGDMMTQVMNVQAAQVNLNGADLMGIASGINRESMSAVGISPHLFHGNPAAGTGGLSSRVSLDTAQMSRMADGIREAAAVLHMEPEWLATIISYETAGTFDPMKLGPTTQHGRHRGLIQFGEPQARQFGVDFSSVEAAIESQLGANGAVVRYFQNAFDGRMDMRDADFANFYAAVNAGDPRRLLASDANNGGAPGTVLDKVNNQMDGHRANAAALLGMNPQMSELELEQMEAAIASANAQLEQITASHQQYQESLAAAQGATDQATTATQSIQQMGDALPQVDNGLRQAAQAARDMAPPMSAASTALRDAGLSAQQSAASAQIAQTGLTGMNATMQQVSGQTGAVGGAIVSMIQQIMSAAGMGGFAPILGMLFHTGGKVGSASNPTRKVSSALFANAPRFHNGLKNDEYPAILQRGERVLTADQDNRMMSILGAVAQAGDSRASMWGGGGGGGGRPVTINYNISTPDAGGFRRTQTQIDSRAATAMRRAEARSN